MDDLTPDPARLADLDEKFPLWTCECKRAYAALSYDEATESPYKCPTCGHVYDGMPWFQCFSTADGGTEVERHDCWPPSTPRRPDQPCVLCAELPKPWRYHWNCDCRSAIDNVSQDQAMASPFWCSTCGRVWDGRNWFKSMEWYNVITTWENLQGEAEAILRTGSAYRLDDEYDEWVLELMDFCDKHSKMDSTAFWRLGRSFNLPRREPLDTPRRAKIEEALEECRPIMELFWHRGESFPWRPDEWEDASEFDDGRNDEVDHGPPDSQQISDLKRRVHHELAIARANLGRHFEGNGCPMFSVDELCKEMNCTDRTLRSYARRAGVPGLRRGERFTAAQRLCILQVGADSSDSVIAQSCRSLLESLNGSETGK